MWDYLTTFIIISIIIFLDKSLLFLDQSVSNIKYYCITYETRNYYVPNSRTIAHLVLPGAEM